MRNKTVNLRQKSVTEKNSKKKKWGTVRQFMTQPIQTFTGFTHLHFLGARQQFRAASIFRCLCHFCDKSVIAEINSLLTISWPRRSNKTVSEQK